MGFTRPLVIYRHMEVPVIYQNFGCPEHLVGRQKNWQVGTCFVIALSGEVPAPKMCRIVNRFSFVQILCVCVRTFFFFVQMPGSLCTPKGCSWYLACLLSVQFLFSTPTVHYSNSSPACPGILFK